MRALDLAEAVEAGDITPAALVEMCAERARESEGLHLFAHLDLERARAAAASQRLDAGLFGLPIGIKDIIDTAHLPTRYGSPIYAKNYRPPSDAAIVSVIEEACGIVLGKTVTTEFAFLQPSETLNPHDAKRTPGGSSSGSAAAVAAGVLPLALGTQTGGSVIRPASFCGVAAIKPSYRLLPMQGVKPFAPLLDTLGVFGARVVDIAFALSVLAGRPLRVDGQDFGTPTFGVARQPFAGAPEPEAEAGLNVAIRALEQAGARVVEAEFGPLAAKAHAGHKVINNYEGAQSLLFELRHKREKLSPILIEALEDGHATPPEVYDGVRGDAMRARREVEAVFQPVDAILTYAAPGYPPTPESTGDARYNKLMTLLGVPAVNVPLPPALAGEWPLGVQVVAGFGEDLRALAAAAFLEDALGRL
ncbi:MAG: amidase [Proteobacteria bacterium]|nr:amidase [Pseudomonadota bacterium]